MKTNANDLSSPKIESNQNREGILDEVYSTGGLTKREQFAAMAMQGMLSGKVDAHAHGMIDNYEIARYSVNLADALINALNKEVSGE